MFHRSWALSWSCFLFRASSCRQWVTAFLLSQPFRNILILCCVFHLKVLLTQLALTFDHIDAEADVKSVAVFLIRGASVTSPPVSSARLSDLRQRCSKSCPARRGAGILPGNDLCFFANIRPICLGIVMDDSKGCHDPRTFSLLSDAGGPR